MSVPLYRLKSSTYDAYHNQSWLYSAHKINKFNTITSSRVLVQSTTYLASASALSDCIAGGFLAAAAAAIVA